MVVITPVHCDRQFYTYSTDLLVAHQSIRNLLNSLGNAMRWSTMQAAHSLESRQPFAPCASVFRDCVLGVRSALSVFRVVHARQLQSGCSAGLIVAQPRPGSDRFVTVTHCLDRRAATPQVVAARRGCLATSEPRCSSAQRCSVLPWPRHRFRPAYRPARRRATSRGDSTRLRAISGARACNASIGAAFEWRMPRRAQTCCAKPVFCLRWPRLRGQSRHRVVGTAICVESCDARSDQSHGDAKTSSSRSGCLLSAVQCKPDPALLARRT
jgi:hypothetical protein